MRCIPLICALTVASPPHLRYFPWIFWLIYLIGHFSFIHPVIEEDCGKWKSARHHKIFVSSWSLWSHHHNLLIIYNKLNIIWLPFFPCPIILIMIIIISWSLFWFSSTIAVPHNHDHDHCLNHPQLLYCHMIMIIIISQSLYWLSSTIAVPHADIEGDPDLYVQVWFFTFLAMRIIMLIMLIMLIIVAMFTSLTIIMLIMLITLIMVVMFTSLTIIMMMIRLEAA